MPLNTLNSLKKIVKKPKVGIFGGSLAGLTAGVSLSRNSDYDVTIFERSKTLLKGRGAGIALPPSMVQKCIELDLFDKTIPQGPAIGGRVFLTKDKTAPNNTRTIWQQALSLTTFNWAHLYSNLLKRFPEERYLAGYKGIDIIQTDKSCEVEIKTPSYSKGNYKFDTVIAADGAQSFISKKIFLEVAPQFENFIAWRGIITDQEIVNDKLFDGYAPVYVFENGHLLLYRIPAPDYETSQKMVLNWLMYEYPKEISVNQLMMDKEGIRCDLSVPPGKVSPGSIAHFFDFAYEVLPTHIADIVCQTPALSIQAICDFQVPSFVKGRIVWVGDSGCVTGPFVASGALRGLSGGISLAEAMDPTLHSNIYASLSEWNEIQMKLATGQRSLAKLMGKGLVTEPPHWPNMTAESTSLWFNTMLQGKQWHATSTKAACPENFGVSKKKQYTPSYKAEKDVVEKLCAKVENMALENKNGFKTTVPR